MDIEEEGRWNLLRTVSWLAGVGLAISLAAAAWSYLRDGRLERDTRHDNALIITGERLLSSLKDVETGQRGFIITGKDEYLEPYRSGLAAVGPDLATLEVLDSDAAKRCPTW